MNPPQLPGTVPQTIDPSDPASWPVAMTVPEVSAVGRCCTRVVENAIKAGILARVRTHGPGSKSLRVQRASVWAWLGVDVTGRGAA